MDGLTMGRIVMYTDVSGGPGDLGIRPAMVTHVWQDEGMVNLSVFRDGSYDASWMPDSDPKTWELQVLKTSVKYDVDGAIGTWCWPQRAAQDTYQSPRSWKLEGKYVVDAAGHSVAYVCNVRIDDYHNDEAATERHAWIIAAGPDLVNACQQATAWIENLDRPKGTVPACLGVLNMALRRAMGGMCPGAPEPTK